MLHSILQITGLEQKLEALRDRIEGQAQSLMQQGKAVAIQMAIASALGAAAAILGLMALVAGLIALFFWLEPQMGSIAAMGLIAVGLLVVGVILAVSAAMIGRKETPRVPAVVANPATTADIAAARTVEERLDTVGHEAPSRDHLGLGGFQPARPVTAEEGQKLAEELGAFKYVECSALTGKGLNAVFEECIRSCLHKNSSSKAKKGEKKLLRREKCVVL